MMIWKSRKEKFSFTDAELAVAAGKVCEAMLNSLPEPEECKREFSAEFEQKMKKLFAKEKTFRIMVEIRRYVAAALILLIIGMGTIFAFNTEARAAFVDWVRRVYENSIIYEFFNEPTAEKLPTYELGWVPEGYEVVDMYQSENLCGLVYQKGEDVTEGFVFDYQFGDSGMHVELHSDLSKYEVKQESVAGRIVDLYLSQEDSESSVAVWLDESSRIVFTINGFLKEIDILHIIEEVYLAK